MKKHLFRLLAFSGTVVLLVLVLKGLNRLPLVVQDDFMRRYSDLDEIRGTLQMPSILVPSFFPQNLSWPPSTILAQGNPFPAVIMEFEKTGGKETVLLISQSTSEEFLPDDKIRIVEVKESVAYPLKGRNALLTVGMCRNEEPCCGISWKEKEYRIHVLSRSTPFELIKIAESMLR